MRKNTNMERFKGKKYGQKTFSITKGLMEEAELCTFADTAEKEIPATVLT